MQQKQVKIINFKADRFGIFQAIELDFNQFNQGVIALKGNSGSGKSTTLNGIKTGVQGRATLADQEQYGEDWNLETQLLDGERKIFVEAVKRKGENVTYKLYEKDLNGKKVMTPVVDGIKATPSKYMDLISTELTFGIDKFLSKDNTEHKKFMFQLFKPELKKLGVIFDKKDSNYKESILGQLDALTYERDKLRAVCTHLGAFVSDFERDGYKKEDLACIEFVEVDDLLTKKNELLIKKGSIGSDKKIEIEKKKSELNAGKEKLKSDATLDFEKKKIAVKEKGQSIVNKVRNITHDLNENYRKSKLNYDQSEASSSLTKSHFFELESKVNSAEYLSRLDKEAILTTISIKKNTHVAKISCIEPTKPICPPIENSRLKPALGVVYDDLFTEQLTAYTALSAEYMSLELDIVDTTEIDKQLNNLDTELLKVQDTAEIDQQIQDAENAINNAKNGNKLVERYDANRDWVDSDAKVTIKRKELALLYAQVNTGVSGLHMQPFYNKDEKMEIKTVYTGEYAPEYFKPLSSDDKESKRLLAAYSFTQRAVIGVLLQVARLKIKSKALNYIFLDDVPIDAMSRKVITRIAAENSLNIITSITGDFTKEKLTENEMLVENGHVFFNK